ncbi:hypothetical protein Q0Z83_017480 [Actinoplanes sichuanensis]|uniref:Polymer-forming cytoskeletal protein n=1 Tax=Actinoplanes sichuanensis TaxID=512349 RepID=A0ABW4A915_9ACTN|nr:hypothetical protein [Actinoplanes sichuanensis]BEL03557.1 hypothetical protein Q0Z83_017480 [Actinoplanes sichuanensis]
MFFEGEPRPVWERVPVGEAGHDLGEISQESVYLEDLYGEEPEYLFVHRGDVTVAGPLVAEDDWGDEISTMYVIEGDLTVHGPAVFRNMDSNTALYVTGSVRVRDLACSWHGQLFVGGALVVEGVLFTRFDDAGHLVVHGSFSAGVWIEGGGRGAIYLPEVSGARLIGAADGPYFGAGAVVEGFADGVVAEFLDEDGRPVRDLVEKALLDGRSPVRVG